MGRPGGGRRRGRAYLPGLLDPGAPAAARPPRTPPAGEIAVLALGLLLLFAVGFAVSLWLQRRRQRRQARANR